MELEIWREKDIKMATTGDAELLPVLHFRVGIERPLLDSKHDGRVPMKQAGAGLEKDLMFICCFRTLSPAKKSHTNFPEPRNSSSAKAIAEYL